MASGADPNADVPEHVPADAFDLPVSHMLGDEKTLANNRATDAVSAAKQKLAEQTGAEPDALKLLLVVDGDPPTQIDLDIETRTLGEYGVGRDSKLMWQAQNPADAKQRRDDREAERLRASARPRRSVCVPRRPSTRRRSDRPRAGCA